MAWNIGSWFKPITNINFTPIKKYFVDEDKIIIEYFTPMMNQVKEEALRVGKQDLQIGFKILTDAAIGAAIAGLTAPPGTNIAVAEATFLTIGIKEGIDAIHNAEASMIKGAVAIVQVANTVVVGNTVVTTNTSSTVVTANTGPIA